MSGSLKGKYLKNSSLNGGMPMCGECKVPYSDGHVGEVKNYPDDGIVAVFFTCEECGKESTFYYTPLLGVVK